MNKKLEKLRELTDDELREESKKLKDELFQLKFQLALKQLENTAKVRQIKRSIAQIETIKQERILANSKEIQNA